MLIIVMDVASINNNYTIVNLKSTLFIVKQTVYNVLFIDNLLFLEETKKYITF